MRSYIALAAGVLAALALLFVLAEAIGFSALVDPSPWMTDAGVAAALVGVGLLTVDVFLPVPSSFVMVAHGTLFGVWVGTLLSVAGAVGATLVGFALGRAGEGWMARLVDGEERARADRLLQRWGLLAVVLTRPLPLVAETVAILAGASPLGWRGVAAAAAAGSLPPALLYALTGALAGDFASGALVLALVLLTTGIFWWVGRKLGGRPEAPIPS